MDINYFSKGKRMEPISVMLQAVLGISRWLTEFFSLTEEDRINVGNRRHSE